MSDYHYQIPGSEETWNGLSQYLFSYAKNRIKYF